MAVVGDAAAALRESLPEATVKSYDDPGSLGIWRPLVFDMGVIYARGPCMQGRDMKINECKHVTRLRYLYLGRNS